MTTFELIACFGAALTFLACVLKIITCQVLTLRLYGVEIKAEHPRPSLPPAKE